MASFLTDIWSSVFEGGTNQSLLIATYSSFAALQTTLIGLLFATGSYHFVALNVICGGLWAAVAWFVKELEQVKRLEEEGDRLRKERERREKLKEGEEDEGKKEL
ncbi:Pkr1-domain-containing protein [Ascodesmis nigricans]|uniref:Pkr1-domain-containing protein n=1 Tax=Ascodesmis nigricans TaxID=341454 RepID=A0A4S2N734_9PEZI|nr:Pkr1-domain-containing protein [Ascodesmis nigricans]